MLVDNAGLRSSTAVAEGKREKFGFNNDCFVKGLEEHTCSAVLPVAVKPMPMSARKGDTFDVSIPAALAKLRSAAGTCCSVKLVAPSPVSTSAAHAALSVASAYSACVGNGPRYATCVSLRVSRRDTASDKNRHWLG